MFYFIFWGERDCEGRKGGEEERERYGFLELCRGFRIECDRRILAVQHLGSMQHTRPFHNFAFLTL